MSAPPFHLTNIPTAALPRPTFGTELPRVLFVINPRAGYVRRINFPALLSRHFDRRLLYDSVVRTEAPGHAHELATQAVREGYQIVVSIGGDGTINEIGSALLGTDTALGIIPLGSGNGLARHLGVPLRPARALQLLATGQPRAIDCGFVNGRAFFCTTGVGFDAYVGHLFAKDKQRGFSRYLQTSLRAYWRYQPRRYRLTVDEDTFEREAVVLTVANASQYGNNAFIAPQAVVNDGQLDLCVIRPFAHWQGVGLTSRLFAGTLPRSPLYESRTARQVTIDGARPLFAHYDGEPYVSDGPLEISLQPRALRVIVPAAPPTP